MEINKYNKNIQLIIRQFREHKWITICNEINETKGKNYWQQIRKLSNYKSSSFGQPIKMNNNMFSTNQERAEIFDTYFADIFRENTSSQFCHQKYDDIQLL